MNKIVLALITLVLLSANTSFAQKYKYRVSFTDKNNSIYSVSNPSAFLSQKAITRRNNQGIGISLQDIPVNKWYVDSLIAKGAYVYNTSKWFNSCIIGLSDTNLINNIIALPFVSNVKKVVAFNAKKKKESKQSTATNTQSRKVFFTPDNNQNYLLSNKQQYKYDKTKQAGRNINYGPSQTQIAMMNGDFLHQQGFMGNGMTVAILDAGFNGVNLFPCFDSLWQNGQILGTRDFVDPTANVFDQATHGMMVLSDMAAYLPGELVGTAPKANYWLIRTEDANSENLIEEDNWVAGAEFADSLGVDVINSSLGYTLFDDTTMNHTYQELDGKTARVSIGATLAARKGILVVNSAGNSGATPWRHIGFPSDADSIITVGAVDSQGNYAYFSSQGPTFDGRIKPTVCAMGQGAIVAVNGGTSPGNGTSFASPILCGLATCLWQAFPFKTNQEIIASIKQTASQYNNPDTLMGYGIPNFSMASIILSGSHIYNIDNENNFNVYPNPFDDKLFIAYNSIDTQRVQIELFDITGKKLLEVENLPRLKGYNSITLTNLSTLQKGIYVVRLTYGNRTSTKKILKT